MINLILTPELNSLASLSIMMRELPLVYFVRAFEGNAKQIVLPFSF